MLSDNHLGPFLISDQVQESAILTDGKDPHDLADACWVSPDAHRFTNGKDSLHSVLRPSWIQQCYRCVAY
jgi:hypothetical protein